MDYRPQSAGKQVLRAAENSSWLYLLSFYCLFLSIPTMSAHAQPSLAPVPSKAERTKIRKSLGTSLDSLSGKQVLERTQNVDDLNQKYVLLQEAGKKFVEKRNVKRAMQTIDTMSQTFLVNETRIKGKVLIKICGICIKKDRIPLREISTQATKLAKESVDNDNFTQAVDFYELAIKAASKEQNQPLVRKIEKKRDIAIARRDLKKQPKDPASNRIVGEYFCFEQNDWEKGLTHLSSGDDKQLAELASLELKNSFDPTNQQTITQLAEAADGWLKAAKSSRRKKNQRDALKTHAEKIYAQVLPALDDRDKKLKIIENLEGTQDKNYVLRHPLLRGNFKNDPEKAVPADAVERGIRWLANHQNLDGSWSFNHTRGDKCSGFANPGDDISPGNSPRVAATGMALLPFLANGYTHKSAEHNQYADVVRVGLNFLRGKMERGTGKLYDSKYWHYHMYSHGIAACALAEAYGMTQDPKLKIPAQKAISYIAASQKPQTGGWHYTPSYNGPGDTSVVGWQIMALKSALMAYLIVPGHVKPQANKWLDRVGFDRAAGGGFSRYGYMNPEARGTVVDNDGAMTAMGLLCRTYLGIRKNNPGQRKGVEWLASMGPARDNIYHNYHASMAIFQNDGPDGQLWKNWKLEMQNMLVNSQVRQGSDEGSWYYGGNHGHTGGRLMSTCLATLMLQCEYRYPLTE